MLHVAIEALLAIFHISEEQVKETNHCDRPFLIWFNRLFGYFNRMCGDRHRQHFPLSQGRNLVVNTIVLGITLVALAVVGHWWWTPAESIFLGFILIDALAHLGLSVSPWARRRTKMLSPGWVTSIGYLILVFWRWEIVELHPIWASIGGLFLLATYAEAGFKVWRRHRRERLEEMTETARRQQQELMEEFRRGRSDSAGGTVRLGGGS